MYDILNALCNHAGPELVKEGYWDIFKFPNGVAMCWCAFRISANITSKYGSDYLYLSNPLNFPTGLFIEIPRAFANCYIQGAQWAQVQDPTKDTYKVRLYYPEEYPSTIEWPVSVFAIGRWK